MENMHICHSRPGYDGLDARYDETEPDVQLTPLQTLERDKETVRKQLWTMPLQSANELATTTDLSLDRVYKVLKNIRRHGLVTRASLGRAGGVRQRWWLTTQGVLQTSEDLGLPIPWQVTENGLRWLVRRLPAAEAFYATAPHLFSHPDVLIPHQVHLTPDPDEPPTIFTDGLKMVEFEWMRDGEIHAVARYDNGSWIPLIWVGSMVSGTVIKRKAQQARHQLDDGLRPAGWVVICDDGLAAKQSADAWTNDNALVMIANGTALRHMRPSSFTRRSLQETAAPRDLGAPEAIATWLQQDGSMLALNGVSAYSMFRFVAEFPGATPDQLETGFGMAYRATLRPLRRAGLVVRLDGAYYLDRAGILAVAHMDRISWQSVHARLGAYLRPDGVYRRSQARHNRAVVNVMLTLYGRDILACGGWRAVHNIPGITQVIPDVIVLTERDDGTIYESFIEVEFTARTPAQIENKLEPYRLVLQHAGERINCIFLVEDARARQRYASAGAGLVSVLTLEEFRTGDLD